MKSTSYPSYAGHDHNIARNLILSTGLSLSAFIFLGGQMFVLFWACLAVGVVAAILAAGFACQFLAGRLGASVTLSPFLNTVLVVLGVMTVVIAGEAYLGWRERAAISNTQPMMQAGPSTDVGKFAALAGFPLPGDLIEFMMKRRNAITLPKAWDRHQESVKGARYAYRWHNVLHVHDEHGFRRVEAFPQKKRGVFRIMVVGDSLTYGYGVGEEWTYSSRLSKQLNEKFVVEVLNLGVSGYQSEDITHVVETFIPVLEPDLVLYGVCLNDFLPSGAGQYQTRGFEFPLPERFQRFLSDRTRVAQLTADLYDRSLRVVGLRADFFDDILKDFNGYQQRFRRDVARMNEAVTNRGLPPIVAVVLDQYPNYGGRGHQIARAAERYLKEAGMDVVETDNYYKLHDGHVFRVSAWEGHPDEEAHAIFASLLYERLTRHPALQPYKRVAS